MLEEKRAQDREIQANDAAIKLQCAHRRMEAWRKSDELRKAATKMELEELQRQRALCAARQELRALCAARQEAATKLQRAQRRRTARKGLDELRTAMRKVVARSQLHYAVQRREIAALGAVLEEAKAARTPTKDMDNAELVLGEERKKLAARNQLHDAIAALEAALEEVTAAGVTEVWEACTPCKRPGCGECTCPRKRRIDWQTPRQTNREAKTLLDVDDSGSESSESTASATTSQSSCFGGKGSSHARDDTSRTCED